MSKIKTNIKAAHYTVTANVELTEQQLIKLWLMADKEVKAEQKLGHNTDALVALRSLIDNACGEIDEQAEDLKRADPSCTVNYSDC